MRYSMRLSKLGKPLLALFGGVQSRSYVDVTDDAIQFRFGIFDETIPLPEVAGVARDRVPFIAGLGWKMGPGGFVGLIGSQDGIVKVSLRDAIPVKVLFLPIKARHILVSLDDPEAFIADVQKKRAGRAAA